MVELIADLRRSTIVRHFVKYSLVGSLNVVVYGAILNILLSSGARLAVAIAPAFVVTSGISYALNRHWTFRDRMSDTPVRQYAVFVLFTAVGLGINETVAHVALLGLHRYGRVGENIAAYAATPLSILWNFTAYRRWTFRPASAAS